jgi:hypothetical protein
MQDQALYFNDITFNVLMRFVLVAAFLVLRSRHLWETDAFKHLCLQPRCTASNDQNHHLRVKLTSACELSLLD